jgi:hypothetical protein
MCEHLDYTATDRPRNFVGLHRLARLLCDGQKGMDTMSDRPQWMNLVDELGVLAARVEHRAELAEKEHSAVYLLELRVSGAEILRGLSKLRDEWISEGARVQELRRETADLLKNGSCSCGGWTCPRCELSIHNVRKALQAFEPVSASSAGGE